MSQKIILQVVLKKGTSHRNMQKMVERLGDKVAAVDRYRDDRWRLTVAFDDVADYLAFQVAAGLIKIVPASPEELAALGVGDVNANLPHST